MSQEVRYVSSSSTGASIVWFLIGAFLSWVVNHSVFWALVHGFCGPFYVLYLCLGYGGGIDSVQRGVENLQPPVIEVHQSSGDNAV